MKEVLEGGLELERAPALHRQLPRLPGVRDRLPVRGPVRRAHHTVPRATPSRAASARRSSACEREMTLRVAPVSRAAARRGVRAGPLARPFAGLLPPSMRAMLGLLPRRVPGRRPLPAVHPAEGPRRARVALLAGCAQQVLAPDINWATLRVLARNGVETVIPTGQGCCGALADAHRRRAPAPSAGAAQPGGLSRTMSTPSSPTRPGAARGCAGTDSCSPARPTRRPRARSPSGSST